jgi:hypothetical protein
MAAPHVAGVVANMLGNAPTLTPAQVATQLVATATKATLTGLPAGTTNALLYQQPASASSFSLSAEVDSPEIITDDTEDDSSNVEYEIDPGVPQPPVVTVPPGTNDGVTATPVVENVPAVPTTSPARSTNGTPAVVVPTPAVPQQTSAMTTVSIGKITKVGKQLRVTVNAPKGSSVSLYRNGKLVGKGAKKFFMVPASQVKKQSFTAVISIAGAFVSSASVSLR